MRRNKNNVYIICSKKFGKLEIRWNMGNKLFVMVRKKVVWDKLVVLIIGDLILNKYILESLYFEMVFLF